MKGIVRLVRDSVWPGGKERMEMEIVGGGWLIMPNRQNLVAGDEVEIEFTLIPSGRDLDAHVEQMGSKS